MATQATQQQEQISAEAGTICYQLHVRMPGIRRKADIEQVDLNGADEEMMGVSKLIVDSDEFRAIQRQVRYMKSYVRARSVPSPIFKGGVYQLPLAKVEEVNSTIDGMTLEFWNLVDAFLAAYDGAPAGKIFSLKQEAQNRLGPQFDEDDYPPSAKLRKAFGVYTRFLETGVPGKLRSISRSLFEQEQERVTKTWANLEVEISAMLRAEMQGLIEKMVDALDVNVDGKRKAFRKSNVSKLSEFLREAPFRNVTNDAQLADLVSKTAKLLDGVDAEVIKKDDGYRDAVRHSFGVVKQRLDALVAEKPRRAIRFDEED